MTSTAGDGWWVATWLAVLALACGRADTSSVVPVRVDASSTGADEASPSPSDASTGDGNGSDDAGVAPSSGDGAACPPPRRGVPESGGAWMREPGTRNCCLYDNLNAAPAGWIPFDDEAACKSECLCAALDGVDGALESLPPVRDTLECRCSLESCPSTLEEAEQSLCAVTSPFQPPAVQRLVGCGLVMVADRNGFSGLAWIFEQSGGSGDAAPTTSGLVGGSRLSDADSIEPCPTTSWAAGRDFFTECDDAQVVTCQLCGDSPGPEYPPCE